MIKRPTHGLPDDTPCSPHRVRRWRAAALAAALAATVAAAVLVATIPLARADDQTTPAAPATLATSAVPPAAGAIPPIYTDVNVTKDIPYRQAVTWDGNPIELAFDLYEPAGDTRTNRPLFIWIHGGSFAFGDKADALDVNVATEIAKRGMVAISINYRLGPDVASGGIGGVAGNQSLIQAILRAYEDAREAVRFMRERATDYRLNPDRIFIGGASAGAVTSLNVGYLPDRAQGAGGPTDPYRVAGVVSIAGETLTPFVQAGEPDVFMAHGTQDTIVPYSEALAFCEAARAVAVSCAFESYPTDHIGMIQYFDDVLEKSSNWLSELLVKLDSQVPPPSTPTTPSPVTAAVVVAPAFTG